MKPERRPFALDYLPLSVSPGGTLFTSDVFCRDQVQFAVHVCIGGSA